MLFSNKPESLITHFVINIKHQSEYLGIDGLARNLQLHALSLLPKSPSSFSPYEVKAYEKDPEKSRSNYF